MYPTFSAVFVSVFFVVFFCGCVGESGTENNTNNTISGVTTSLQALTRDGAIKIAENTEEVRQFLGFYPSAKRGVFEVDGLTVAYWVGDGWEGRSVAVKVVVDREGGGVKSVYPPLTAYDFSIPSFFPSVLS